MALLALHVHQVGRRTLTSKLLNMPSTRRRPLRGETIHCRQSRTRYGRRSKRAGSSPGHQSLKRLNVRRGFTSAEKLGAMHVKGGEIGAGTSPRVLVFNPDGLTRTRRRREMDADAGLDARFLVGRDNRVRRLERARGCRDIGRTNRECGQLSGQTRDRVERCTCGAATGEWHRPGATATPSCR